MPCLEMGGYAGATGGRPPPALTTLVNRITEAAKQAASHQSNCRQLANHVNIIGTMLAKLKSVSFPATAEPSPFDELELAMAKALDLLESCMDRSHLYMVAVGWGAVYRFRQLQAEIDLCVVRLLRWPLISLAGGMEEKLKDLEEDVIEFTLDEEEIVAQIVLAKDGRTGEDAKVLEVELRRRYPDLGFDDALKVEREKLRFELRRLQVDDEYGRLEHYRLIQRLIDVTENVVNLLPEKSLHPNVLSQYGSVSWKEKHNETEWQADLFGCCADPCLSLMTCLYPCGTFQQITQVISQGKISEEEACSDLSTFCLFCGCCCYTCHVRQEVHNLFGTTTRKMIPPPFQYMRS